MRYSKRKSSLAQKISFRLRDHYGFSCEATHTCVMYEILFFTAEDVEESPFSSMLPYKRHPRETLTNRPASALSSDVLPLPEGPSMARNSPCARLPDRSWRISLGEVDRFGCTIYVTCFHSRVTLIERSTISKEDEIEWPYSLLYLQRSEPNCPPRGKSNYTLVSNSLTSN